ncbi:hypothetical protein JCM3775_003248 [Rhodotorula graminis]
MAARVTRSSTKSQSTAESLPPPASPSKRARPPTSAAGSSSSSGPAPPSTPKSKRAKQQHPAPDSPYVPPTPGTQRQIEDDAHRADEEGEKEGTVLLHPALRFKYADAKAHLIKDDKRWRDVMAAMPCKPFEGDQLEPFNPFRTLVSSILGAQISWLAARAIQHKFVRLFFPHLPEKLAPPASGAPKLETPFPTPRMVLDLPDRFASLRGAGLSGRKVEYVVELAERFSDGRLDARKLWGMEDDELVETLVAIRGIGPWTSAMFLIFASKRADVLPVGDLGIQKNLCKWFSHDPSFVPAIHPAKLAGAAPASPTKLASSKGAVHPPPTPGPGEGNGKGAEPEEDEDEEQEQGREQGQELRSAAQPGGDKQGEGHGLGKLAALGAVEVEQERVIDLDGEAGAPKKEEDDEDKVEKGQEEEVEGGEFKFPETSNGLTPGVLKARLGGKKLKGNIYLSPKEMEELTASWRPYRSVACWYLWSLADGDGDP